MLATSSGSPARPRGVAAMNCAMDASDSGVGFVNGVRISPGCTEFTRMLRGANSTAAALVMPRTANFEAVYASVYGAPTRPATEEMLMIEPPPAFIIDGN